MAAVGRDEVPAARRQTRQRFLLTQSVIAGVGRRDRHQRQVAVPTGRGRQRFRRALSESTRSGCRARRRTSAGSRTSAASAGLPAAASASAPAASPDPPPRAGRLSMPTGRLRGRRSARPCRPAPRRRAQRPIAPPRRPAGTGSRPDRCESAPWAPAGPSLRDGRDRRGPAPPSPCGYRAAKMRITKPPNECPTSRYGGASPALIEHLLQLVDDAAGRARHRTGVAPAEPGAIVGDRARERRDRRLHVGPADRRSARAPRRRPRSAHPRPPSARAGGTRRRRRTVRADGDAPSRRRSCDDGVGRRHDRGGGSIDVGLGRRPVADRDAERGHAVPGGAAGPARAVRLQPRDHVARHRVGIGAVDAHQHLIEHDVVEHAQRRVASKVALRFGRRGGTSARRDRRGRRARATPSAA